MRCDGSSALESPICSLVPWQATTGVSRALPMTSTSLCNFLSNQFRVCSMSFDDFYLSEHCRLSSCLAPTSHQFNAIDRRSRFKN